MALRAFLASGVQWVPRTTMATRVQARFIGGSEDPKLSQRVGHEVVAVFGGRPAAEVARGLLETHGIDANLLVDDSGGLAPVAELTEGVRLIVRADRAVEARELLAADHRTTTDGADQRPPAAAVRLSAAALAIVFVAMILYNALQGA